MAARPIITPARRSLQVPPTLPAALALIVSLAVLCAALWHIASLTQAQALAAALVVGAVIAVVFRRV